MKKLRESITHYTLSTPRKRTKHLWAQYSSVARRSPIRNRLSLTTTQINNVLILKVNYWTRMQRRKRQADTDSFKIKNSGGKKTGTRHGWEMVGERRMKGGNWERLLTSRTWTLSKVLFEMWTFCQKTCGAYGWYRQTSLEKTWSNSAQLLLCKNSYPERGGSSFLFVFRPLFTDINTKRKATSLNCEVCFWEKPTLNWLRTTLLSSVNKSRCPFPYQ